LKGILPSPAYSLLSAADASKCKVYIHLFLLHVSNLSFLKNESDPLIRSPQTKDSVTLELTQETNKEFQLNFFPKGGD